MDSWIGFFMGDAARSVRLTRLGIRRERGDSSRASAGSSASREQEHENELPKPSEPYEPYPPRRHVGCKNAAPTNGRALVTRRVEQCQGLTPASGGRLHLLGVLAGLLAGRSSSMRTFA